MREKLLAGRAIAELNVELMKLDRNVPGVPGWEEIPAPAPDSARLRSFFEKYELHRLVAEVKEAPAAPAPSAASIPAKPAGGQMNLF